MSGSQELSSWKEIADYLRVSVRTAQKWESTQALPVRRTPGSKGRVMAVAAELAQWQGTHLKGVAWWKSVGFLRWYALALTAALVAFLGHEFGSHYLRAPSGEPATFDVGWNSLTVRNAGGEELWTKVFPHPFQPGAYTAALMASAPKVRFWDLNLDKRRETLFVYTPESDEQDSSTLLCLTERGKEMWRFVPHLEQGSGESAKGRFSFITGLSTARNAGGSPRIFVYACRYPDHKGRLTLLDGLGQGHAAFDHSGHIGQLAYADVDGCGQEEVVLGGVEASSGEAEVILVGMREDMRTGLVEKAKRRFRRTCLSKATEGANVVAKLSAMPRGLRVVVRESGGEDPADVVYVLNERLETRSVWYSDGYRRLHHRLEEEGRIGHPVEIGQERSAGPGETAAVGLSGG